MKKILFYCQYLTGMGHLVRSREIVNQLVKNFEVSFINGGPPVPNFQMPSQVQLVSLPPLWIEKGQLKAAEDFTDVELVKMMRKNKLIEIFNQWQPDCLITEFFPFGRHKLLFELQPLLDYIKAVSPHTKIVCSVRDIVGRSNLQEEEEMICQLTSKYFDLILLHCDPQFQRLEESFSRFTELNCEVKYTGFVAQSLVKNGESNSREFQINAEAPLILASIGGGRIGYQLLDILLESTQQLASKIPHTFQIFTGPFMPEESFLKLQEKARFQKNVNLQRYTPYLMDYMQKSDLSISLTGYNTTMNILQTGVRSLVIPIGHYGQDQEQLIRTQKLEKLGIVEVLYEESLQTDLLTEKILSCLHKKSQQQPFLFDLQGAENTSRILQGLLSSPLALAS